jgi:hypothetical protein
LLYAKNELSEIEIKNATLLITATKKTKRLGQVWWLTSAILATQEAEIGRVMIQSHPRQKFTRHHLSQQLDTEVCICYHSCVGNVK